MWIFAQSAFLSIVEDKEDDDLLLVRARVKGDIEKHFRDAIVFNTPDHDYAYRARLSREEVADVVARVLLDIKYCNYKQSVQDQRRSGFYAQIWNIAWDMQKALGKDA